MTGSERTADPWRDTDVIDERAPRFNQAVVGVVALAGVVFGWPLAWALMGAQLLIGLVQPRIGEGEVEDSRAPRLANMIGAAFLGGAGAAWWLGAHTAATALGALVAALALLAATTGLCVGCEIYRLSARARGISPRHHDHIDPADFGGFNGAGRTYLEFTHPLCSECIEWERKLAAEDSPLVRLDVCERPELARKYGVAIVPTVLAVGADGRVLERLAP